MNQVSPDGIRFSTLRLMLGIVLGLLLLLLLLLLLHNRLPRGRFVDDVVVRVALGLIGEAQICHRQIVQLLPARGVGLLPGFCLQIRSFDALGIAWNTTRGIPMGHSRPL